MNFIDSLSRKEGVLLGSILRRSERHRAAQRKSPLWCSDIKDGQFSRDQWVGAGCHQWGSKPWATWSQASQLHPGLASARTAVSWKLIQSVASHLLWGLALSLFGWLWFEPHYSLMEGSGDGQIMKECLLSCKTEASTWTLKMGGAGHWTNQWGAGETIL